MKEFSISNEACEVLARIYDYDYDYFRRAFYREMNYQCGDVNCASDITLAVVKSMSDELITHHTERELLDRGYWLDGYPSLQSDNFVYSTPSAICPDGTDRYLQALLKQTDSDEVKCFGVPLDVNGLIVLHLVKLYMKRNQTPAVITESIIKKYGGDYEHGKLTIRDDYDTNSYGLIDQLLMYDIRIYDSVIDESTNTCSTTVQTKTGTVSIEDDYYTGKNISDMVEQHLAIASCFDKKSIDIHPELLIVYRS